MNRVGISSLRYFNPIRFTSSPLRAHPIKTSSSPRLLIRSTTRSFCTENIPDDKKIVKRSLKYKIRRNILIGGFIIVGGISFLSMFISITAGVLAVGLSTAAIINPEFVGKMMEYTIVTIIGIPLLITHYMYERNNK